MKRYNVSIVFLLFLFLPGFSQNILNRNFYQLNPFLINPAAAGIHGNVTGFLNYRDQWSGLKGAPESLRFGIHGIISDVMGAGVNIEQNNTGIFKQFSTDLNYSYRIKIDDVQTLAFGLLCGFYRNSIDYNRVKVTEQTDPLIFNSSLIDESLIRLGFGMHYNRKNLNIHLSSPVLYGSQDKNLFQTVYALTTYDFYTADNLLKIQPSVLYRVNTKVSNDLDISITGEWNNNLWAMAGYRTSKSILAGFGAFLRNVGLGYVYEINQSSLSGIASGSHELVLYYESAYTVSKKKPIYKSSKRRREWN